MHHIEHEVFHLEVEYHINYIALQNYLNDTPVQIKRSKSACNGNKKKKHSKLNALKRQGFECLDCNFVFEQDELGNYPTATAEHIIPKRFGSTLALNKEYVCSDCNAKRECDRHSHILRFFGTIYE